MKKENMTAVSSLGGFSAGDNSRGINSCAFFPLITLKAALWREMRLQNDI